MSIEENYKMIMGYRGLLLEAGRKYPSENPDKLNGTELRAVSERILEEISDLDTLLGFPLPKFKAEKTSVSESRIEELFKEAIDWYEVVDTPAVILFKYVKNNYPKDKFRKIVCVGDGEYCHVGRKLAMLGYDVVSVDPYADKKFQLSRAQTGKAKGKLHVVSGEFFDSSEGMIDWADLIIGPKVPCCVQDLVGLKKESVFTISANPEIYNMRFKGVPITSEDVLIKELMKCKTVTAKQVKRFPGDPEPLNVFVSKPIVKEDRVK